MRLLTIASAAMLLTLPGVLPASAMQESAGGGLSLHSAQSTAQLSAAGQKDGQEGDEKAQGKSGIYARRADVGSRALASLWVSAP